MSLAPFFDTDDGLIKVGGRLQLSNLTFGRKHPTLIPDTELGDALIGFLHSLTKHQGRKISSAAIREYGYYPVWEEEKESTALFLHVYLVVPSELP